MFKGATNKKKWAVVIAVVTITIIATLLIVDASLNKESEKVVTNKSNENTVVNTEGLVRAENGYLTIAEYGVRLKLTESTKDMTYYFYDGKAYLSSDSLAQAEPRCAANYDDGTVGRGIASVFYFTDPNAPDPVFGIVKNTEAFPNALQVNDKYYYIFSNLSLCVNKSGERSPDDEALKIEQSLVSAINNQEVVLEKL
jgi:hypothetical protein